MLLLLLVLHVDVSLQSLLVTHKLRLIYHLSPAVPTNKIPNPPDAVPNQYVVSLKPNTQLSQHLAKVQDALTKDALCKDPGAPKSSLDATKGVLVNDQTAGSVYRGVFSDRDVAFIQNTSEFKSISRDRKAVASRKRAVGKSWYVCESRFWLQALMMLVRRNLARLAQPDKLQPGSAGQGSSDTASDWSVGLKDDLGKGVFVGPGSSSIGYRVHALL